MLYIDRRKEILDLIMKDGSVKVSELAKKYDIGEATIRRDLKFLAEQYGVQLTYGGAFLYKSDNYTNITEMNINKKKAQNLEQKKIIAKKAASLIKDGDTIALNQGSTVELILSYLGNISKLNVITLSLNVAVKASTLPFIDVYMPGGKLRSFSGAFYGRDSEEFLKKFNVDKAFLGAAAVSLENGVTHPVLEEVNSNRVLIEISRKNFLVTDTSKFDKISLVKMADLEEFDAFIVDDDIDDKYKD
jgi:DeoR family transcriptional regulator, aga operon transcriptional repressor